MTRLRVVALSLILAAALGVSIRAQQPELHRAGLVVVHGGGRVTQSCVAFSEESITGGELLQRSGLGVTLAPYQGMGYGVCAIAGEGCLAGQHCFCQCQGTPCTYWVYSHRRPDGSWALSGVGASGWQVHDGDVDGWVWGDGSTAPPVVAFEQVCPPDVAAPAAPVATPAPPSPTASQPSPSPSPLPSAIAPTSSPTSVATATAPLQSAPTAIPLPTVTSPPATSTRFPVPSARPTISGTQPSAPGEEHLSVDQGDGVGIAGYAIFGVVVLILVGALILASARRRRT